MNSQDLERRLRELLGLTPDTTISISAEPEFTWDDILAAARIGAEIEREACARLADGYPIATEPGWRGTVAVVGRIVDSIRARGAK